MKKKIFKIGTFGTNQNEYFIEPEDESTNSILINNRTSNLQNHLIFMKSFELSANKSPHCSLLGKFTSN